MNYLNGNVAVAQEKGVMDLYADFVRYRECGQSGEQAWRGLADDLKPLAQRDVMRLMTLIRVWEATDGCAYQSVPCSRPRPFISSDDASEPHVIRRIAPKGGRPSLPHTGLVQTQSNHVAPAGTGHVIQPITMTTSTFSDDMVLYFHVAGHDEPLRIRPYHAPMIIGRYAPESSIVPDINLEPYGAAQCGMSRLHAELTRRGNALILSDMNSVNHTYVNGEELSVKETRALQDGDELRFGTLVVRVQFGTEKTT